MPAPDRLRDVAVRLGFVAIPPSATPAVAAKTSAVGGLTVVGTSSAKVGALVLLVLAAGGGLLATRPRAVPVPDSSNIVVLAPPVPAAEPVIAAASVEQPTPPQQSVPFGSAPPPVWTKPATVRHVPSASPSAQGAAPAASVAPPATLVETEAGLVQQAQRALADNPTRALELTDRADDRFPSGALVQEREVVAIEALVQLGRHDDARARAGHFLRRFPGSVHQRHIETLLGFDTGAHGP